MPFVVMGQTLAAAWLERQTGLCALQRLNLAFLVGGKHHRMLRRIQVQTDNVLQLLDKLRVVAEFEGSRRWGFKPKARHTRRTVASLTPATWAKLRVLQCVA